MEILNTVTLWSALVLGVVASAMVLSMARVMRGGLFGSVLTYFGLGMALVVGSFFAITIPQWTYPEVVKSVHDVVFIFGYVLMGIGAWKLQRGIPSAARGRNVSRQSDEAAGQP